MFLINEIDKILASVLATSAIKSTGNQQEVQISLPDIKRLDVSQFNSDKKIKWEIDETLNRMTVFPGSGHFLLTELTNRLRTDYLMQKTNKRYVTTDLLFIDAMRQLLLEKLTNKDHQENQAGSRIIICDHLCYNLLLKMQRQLNKKSLKDDQISANLLFKNPFNISAILLISEVVDLFERQKKPLLFRQKMQETGQEGYTFNYNLCRAVFPYLKMSSLTLLVSEKGDLDLSSINVKGSRKYLTIQMLKYFARSTQLIEMKSICKLLGFPHNIYNNFVTVIPPDNINSTSVEPESTLADKNPLNQLNLGYLVFMAEHLISLSDQLRLHLISITYKQTDIHGQTRVFSQFVGNKAANLSKKHIQGARVIVLDRLHSLRTALAHADRYGPFLEQEPVYKLLGDTERSRITTQNKLDEKLQLVKLTELLSSIIEYTINLKPSPPTTNTNQNQNTKSKLSLGSSQAIQRHLNIVKITCDVMNEGYLLLTRLESSLLEMANEIASFYWSSSTDGQQLDSFLKQLGEKITRFGEAFKQLIVTAGKSIRATDLFRTAYILLEIIDSYLLLTNEKAKQPTNKWVDAVTELRRSLVSGRKMNENFESRFDVDEQNNKKSHHDYGAIMTDLQSVSGRLLTLQKTPLDLVQTISAFEADKLNIDQQQFSTIKLSARKPSSSDAIILVLIGTITPYELALLKSLENKWKEGKKIGDLFILTSGLLKPEDLIRSLTTREM